MTTLRRLGPLVLILAALAVVAGAAAAGLAARGAAPTWQSTAILDIDQPRVVAAATDPAVLDKLSRLRFKYVGLVGTDRVAVPVATALGEDVGVVRSRISAVARPEDLLIRVVGTAPTAPEAKRTAAALSTGLVQLVAKEQRDDGIPPAEQVEVSLVDVAAPAQQIGPARAAIGLVSLVGGALAGGLVLAVGSLRRRRDLFGA